MPNQRDGQTTVSPSLSTIECFYVEGRVLSDVFCCSWYLPFTILAVHMCALVRVNIVYITAVYIMNVYSHLLTFSKWYKKYSFQTSSLSRKVYGKNVNFFFSFFITKSARYYCRYVIMILHTRTHRNETTVVKSRFSVGKFVP